MKKNVLIIGAGPAGLSAAYKLLKESDNYNVVILEASNDIGGISKTVKYKGNRMDIGGHRFFSKDERVLEFWKEVMPIQSKPAIDYKKLKRKVTIDKTGVDPEKVDDVMLIRNRLSRIYYLDKFFDYPISLKLQTFKNMGLIRTIKAGFSYLKSMIFKKKEDCLENFYINRFGKTLYSMFFEKYTEKLWGRNPKEISADWGAQRVKGLSILVVLKDMLCKIFKIKRTKVETSLIEEFYYPKYGPGHFWETVAKKVLKMGGQIIKKSKVNKINFKNNKIVSVETDTGVYEADIFIYSMPLKDLVNSLSGNKDVSSDIKRIATGLPYRDFVTVGLLVDKLKLENKTDIKTLGNIVPDCWIYVQDPSVKLLRLQIFNNWSPYMLKDPKKTVWIGAEYTCSTEDELWNLSSRDTMKFVSSELEKIGIIDKDSIMDYHVEKIEKAYPSYFDTYSEVDKLIEYVNDFNNLYCVGRNGQHRYNNMDHSIITSFETVDNILNGVDDKSNIWNVNTEKEYHETKK